METEKQKKILGIFKLYGFDNSVQTVLKHFKRHHSAFRPVAIYILLHSSHSSVANRDECRVKWQDWKKFEF